MSKWTGNLAKLLVAGAVATTGLVVGAGSAHANASACRSDTTHNYAYVTNNISIDSCYFVSGGYTMSGAIAFNNDPGSTVVYCAHAINVNTGGWAHDFGCAPATSANTGFVNAGTGGGAAGYSQYWNAPAGTYVVSAGFWLNGTYYGDVQSPRTTIGAH
ncbi:hypothetical protein ACIQOW_03165 [Kitasatospora sp. NPDC091335]|uniref:hypothetical protein n=1 Tax=Kitasatospora sp. NPDC091335 TaxID=3364085 RepID=UPI0037F86ED7